MWEKIGILPHMFWWLWIHENWKIQPFLSQVHEKLFSWAGSRVDQIHWCSRGVYHLRRSQSGQAVQMTWWTCGEFFYSLCGVKDLNLSFAPTIGFPPEFWISLSVPMNRLRSGSIQRLQTGIVPTHAAFCHVQFAFVANGKMARQIDVCIQLFFRLWQITSYWKTQFGSVSFAEQFCEDRFLNGAGYGKNHFFKRQGSQRSRGTRNAKKMGMLLVKKLTPLEKIVTLRGMSSSLQCGGSFPF